MNSYYYVTTVIEGEQLKTDFANRFRFVNQKRYKGKPEQNLEPGVIATLMVVEDHSPKKVDKKTGRELENQVYETFEVTIPGKEYPLPLKKGDFVALGNFMPEVSYFIDHNLILRYDDIYEIKKGVTTNVAGTAQ